MYACQWHIEVPFGKQKEALDIMKRWDSEMSKASDLPKMISTRRTVGHIGESPSHIVNEYVVDNLADWETMMQSVNTGRWQKYSDEMANYIVPGSQHWTVYRVTT